MGQSERAFQEELDVFLHAITLPPTSLFCHFPYFSFRLPWATFHVK